MSSNLPPGVTVGMIPGNRPEDGIAEAAYEALFDGFYAATRAGFSVAEMLEAWHEAACEAAYDDAEDVRADEAMFETWAEEASRPSGGGGAP